MNRYRFDKDNHIHTLDGKPLIGTSSMASVLSKPLTWWASGLAVEKFGWINKGNQKSGWTPKEKRLLNAKSKRDEISTLTDEEYLNLLDEAYAAHSKKLDSSAKDGTDLHEIMEKYIRKCIDENNGIPIKGKSKHGKLNIFIDWAVKNVKRFLWSEVYCYSEELWLGGISDVGYEDMDGKYAILDFKSSKEAYLSQFWQATGYAIQIEENGGMTEDGDVVFKLNKPIDYVAILPFGMDNPEVQFNFDMEGNKEAVKAMLTLYKKLNK